jgi:hypothetical protein
MRSHFLVVVVVVAVFTIAGLPSVALAQEGSSSTPQLQSTALTQSSPASEGTLGAAGDENVIFSGAPEYGGYLATTTQVGQVTDKAGVFLGGRAGIIVSESLTIGGGVSWLVEGPTADLAEAPPIRSVYGGGLLGLTFASDAVVHPTFEMLIGGGEVRVSETSPVSTTRGDNFFVLDASGGFDINLAMGVRLHLGGGYRHISEIEAEGVSTSDLRGFFGTAQLKFGVF